MFDNIYNSIGERKTRLEALSRAEASLKELEPTIDLVKNEIEKETKLLKEANKAKDDSKINEFERSIEDHKYRIDRTRSYIRMNNKTIKESKERIDSIDAMWKKNGVDNPDDINSKLDQLSTQRGEIEDELNRIKEKRSEYVAEAKKQIEEQQKSQKHFSVEDRINYYVKEIGGDLKSFEKVKTAIKILRDSSSSEIDVFIEKIKKDGSVNIGDDVFTENEIKELQSFKNKTMKKSLFFIKKGRLLVKIN
ncbi:MAG: hypothetical protein ACRC4W_05300 [Treponemataceae bacterium]